jgi:hypothetical protein
VSADSVEEADMISDTHTGKRMGHVTYSKRSIKGRMVGIVRGGERRSGSGT